LPSRREQNPRQGKWSKFFKSTFEEPRGITTQHTISYEAVMLHPSQMSREKTSEQ
jgi:hypothetical protein